MDKDNSKCLFTKKYIDFSLLITDPLLLNYFCYNNYYKEINDIYLIKKEDIKIIKFILKYLCKNCKDIGRNINIKDKKTIIINHKCILKTKLLIKFINFIIINLSTLSENISINKDILNKKIYHLIKNLFLYDIATLEDIKIFLISKIILCLYNENFNLKNNNNNEDNDNFKNINIKEFYLLVFEFNKIIIPFVKNIKNVLIKIILTLFLFYQKIIIFLN